jgi:hypothetical protein
MVLLVNDERLMGRHRNGRVANVVAGSCVALVVALDAALVATGLMAALMG